jgi:hypothetical protein
VLDLALFGLLKRRSQYQLPFDDEKGTHKFIKRVYHDFQPTMIGINICEASQEIELTFLIVDGVKRIVFDEMKLREIRGLKELWAIDFPGGVASAAPTCPVWMGQQI